MRKLLVSVCAVLLVVVVSGVSFAGGTETSGSEMKAAEDTRSIPYYEGKMNENLTGMGTSAKGAGSFAGDCTWGFCKEVGTIVEGAGRTAGEIFVGAGQTMGGILKGAADMTGRMAVGAGQSLEGAGKQTGEIACATGKNTVEHVEGAGQTTERIVKGAGDSLTGKCETAVSAVEAQPEMK